MKFLCKAYLFAVAALVSSCMSIPSPQSDDDLRLYPMDCGRLDFDDIRLFGSKGEYDGRAYQMAVMCFLVRHPKGDLVWDAGLPDALNADPTGQTADGMTMRVPVTMQSQIEAVGLSLSEIEYFAPSHSHFDHTGNAALLARSTLLINAAEREFMFGPGAENPALISDFIEPLRSSNTITFEEDYDVFGDGRVVIINAPGHTPGHSVLFVDLKEFGPVLLTGDLYHLEESRQRRIMPVFNFSAPDTVKSMKEFEKRVKESGATVIIQHSLLQQSELPNAPQFLH